MSWPISVNPESNWYTCN